MEGLGAFYSREYTHENMEAQYQDYGPILKWVLCSRPIGFITDGEAFFHMTTSSPISGWGFK